MESKEPLLQVGQDAITKERGNVRPSLKYSVAMLWAIPFVVSLWFSDHRLPPYNVNVQKLNKIDHRTIQYFNYVGDFSFSLTGTLTAGIVLTVPCLPSDHVCFQAAREWISLGAAL
jgi:hypothetical protein